MRRRRKPRAPAPICVYEVSISFWPYEMHVDKYRLRCPKLTKKQMVDGHALVGEVSHQLANGKWTPYGFGCIDGTCDQTFRVIRQHIEPPQLGIAVDNGAKP